MSHLKGGAWIVIPMAVSMVCGCGKEGAGNAGAASGAAATNRSSGNPLTAPVDYLGAVGAAQKRAAQVVDLTSLQQAIGAFQAGEERMPESLQELVREGYLPRLPTAPAGQVFVYDRATGRVGLAPAPRP